MSTILTTTQQRAFVQAGGVAAPIKQHQDFLQQRRQRFMRSASIERIKQFNSFICSQNYFLLPALIAWLKTSQTVFHFHIERCILFLKSIFTASIIYKVFVGQCKACANSLNTRAKLCLHNIKNSDAIPALEMLFFILHHSTSSLVANIRRKLYVLCIYATLVLIFLQLATCIFFMCNAYLPGGLIFLFVCIYLISHLNVSVLFHYLKMEEDKLLNAQSDRKPKKFILGKKTISNLNLF